MLRGFFPGSSELIYHIRRIHPHQIITNAHSFLAHILEPDQCSRDVIAYYKFDRSFRDVCFGHNAQREGDYPMLQQLSGILNGAANFFYGSSKLRVPDLNGYAWGSKFSVSLWFKAANSVNSGTIQGLINNGHVNDETRNPGSWEIQIVSQYNSDNCISASVVTSHSSKTWTNITTAISDHWHHLVMTYDGKTINFYHNSHLKLTDSECCYGDIVSRNNDVVIGHTTTSRWRLNKYFKGYIDEVKLFKKALTTQEVTRLYQLKIV